MSVKTRRSALKLLEKQKSNPEYAKQIGIKVEIVEKEKGEKKS